MSVLLTAVKSKKQPPKSASGRRGSAPAHRSLVSSPQSPQYNIPPVSNSRTAVWYWRQADTMTTVMLPRDTLQLWCNGVSVDASSLMSVGDFEFEIYQASTGQSLEARVLAIRDLYGMTFSLYVDGKFIPEHVAPVGGNSRK